MGEMDDIAVGRGFETPIALSGLLYDGQSATAHDARIFFDKGLSMLRVSAGDKTFTCALAQCEVAPPLGSMARTIGFPGGERFETRDLDSMQRLDAFVRTGRGERWVDSVERRWRMVLLMLACLIGVCTATYIWGIPVASRHIAFALPTSLLDSVSGQVLQIMSFSSDMKDSKLPLDRLKPIQTAFDDMTRRHGGGHTWRLHFKDAPKIGPNAFALPSGDIVITDQLIELAKNDREIAAVLAHEMTHVTQRHGMRMVIQNSGIFILLAGLMGDVASITSLGASLPTLLAQSNYSRKFEIEADAGAAHYCHGCGWSTRPLQGILLRMREKHGEIKGTEAVSSHPDMDRRVKLLQTADEKAGVKPKPEDEAETKPATATKQEPKVKDQEKATR